VVSDIKVARLLLEGDVKRNIRQAEKVGIYKRFDIKSFSGLFTKYTYGEGWDIHRKALAPSFSMSNIRKVIPKLEQCMNEFCDALDKKESNQESFDILDMCSRLLLDAITVGMFDVNFHALKPGSEGEKILHEFDIFLEEYFLKRIHNPLRKYMIWDPKMKRAHQSEKFLDGLCYKILAKYRSTHTPEEIENDTSILGHLVRCPYKNDEHLVVDMLAFLFAGHDTSSITIAWTLIEVARHPQVLVKLRQELDSVHSDWTVPFSFNDVSKLNYLQMVINESMRLRPVAASGQAREAEFDIEVEGGYVIPKGTDCLIYFISMFRQGIKVSPAFIRH
jgi:cytochrome P450